jgi:hypothetical protein
MKTITISLLLLMLAPSVALAHDEAACHPCGCCHRADYHQATVRSSCPYERAELRRKAAQRRRFRETRTVYRWSWRWPS